MPLIDSHVHVWDTDVGCYPWLAGEPDLADQLLPADIDAIADRQPGAKAIGAIFVQAGAVDGVREADWVDQLVWPELLGIVGQAPLELGPGVGSHLRALDAIPRVVGIRRLLQDEPLGFFESDDLVHGLRLVRDRGLTFDACVRHDQLPALTALIARVPELSVVLDHLGKPPVASGGVEGWLEQLNTLAANPWVAVKLSGVAPEADPDRSLVSQAGPFLRAATRAFGPERVMVGSDWPVSAATPHRLGYRDWFSLVFEELAGELDAAGREQIEWKTASDFYGLADRVGETQHDQQRTAS